MNEIEDAIEIILTTCPEVSREEAAAVVYKLSMFRPSSAAEAGRKLRNALKEYKEKTNDQV